MEIVSVFNDKGGVGKTAVSLELAAGLAVAGKTVLLIDNDPQGTLSRCCVEDADGLDGMNVVYGPEEKSVGEMPVQTFIDKLFVVVSGMNLKDVYQENIINASFRVQTMMETLRGPLADVIDVVIIDNPPRQDGVAFDCTLESDTIVIPSRPDDVCYDALVRTYHFLENQAPNFKEKRIVIVPSITENRKMHRDFIKAMTQRFHGRNNNTTVGIPISNGALIPSSIMEKEVLYITHAASQTTKQHRELCLEVFPWLERDEFFAALSQAKEQKLAAIRQQFKEMAQKRLEEALSRKKQGVI